MSRTRNTTDQDPQAKVAQTRPAAAAGPTPMTTSLPDKPPC